MAPTRAERLAQIRELRAKGKTGFDSYQVEEAKDIYETVDDEGYKKIVRSRLDQDDFVVDDNGEGYVDDGREDWQDQQDVYDETDSEDDSPKRGKAAKRKREEEAERREKANQGITKFFANAAAAPKAKPKPARLKEDDEFMAGILDEVNTNVPSRSLSSGKPVKSGDRCKTRVLSPAPEKKAFIDTRAANDSGDGEPALPGASTYKDYDDDTFMMQPDDDMPMPSSPLAKAIEQPVVKIEETVDDEMMEVAEIQGHASVKTNNLNIKGSRPVPPPAVRAIPAPGSSSPVRNDLDISAITNVTEKLNILSSSTDTHVPGKIAAKDALEDDGTLRFFWTDYTEVNGSLCLFGKVKNCSTGDYVSCFVKVDNILRKLYFLPREHRMRHGVVADEEIEMNDVYQEVDGLMSKYRVSMHKIKPSTRKYAFEMADVPKEAEYLKLLYPYDKPVLPMDITGETFSHVFGTNTALFEQFVMWKNIMGPCWLKIKNANFNAVSNASWCKLELLVDRPNNIETLGDADNLEAPPLTLMSLAIRTTMNTKENKNEILVASLRFYENVSLTDTRPPEQLPCRTFTIMRPHGEYPLGFKAEAEKHRGQIKAERNEGALLSIMLAIIQRYDPDAILGHRLDDVDFNVLLTRMRDRKTPGWHRIGRLKRSEWPKNIGKGGASIFVERHIAAGRLLVDLANDMGKSIMTGCQSWSLDEMVKLYLGGSNLRRDIDNDKALAMASTREGLMNYVRLCEADTYFIAALALKRQLLPLTKVLTNLAGNSWARTLSGTRAERNEYILLHEFHRGKYICPDKVYGKGPAKKATDDGEDAGKKKDKYKGGLVFEPEKGLYDKFVLVMDFNSLYPSIIQEYNICFTTVERGDIKEGEDRIPDVPDDVTNKGILPRLIRTLVSRRREVKKLMKGKGISDEQYQTWDVKQQALKLTANSMYGCLGYARSRFYARPLAALTTAKGREILQSTKDLAESAHALRVIYGDTDSVMVNTNQDNIQDAIKLGNEFKKAVNEQYELLEIEIDNIFRRLLLHAKKKYAAINMVETDGVWTQKMEVKGLDMKRREYCQLSKDTSSELLSYLLSGEDPEKVVSQIHDHLRALGKKMRNNGIPAHKYTIYTQLGKAPKDYPNGNSMPSVQVALKLMARGKPVKANDVMAFIICGENNGSAEKAAQNAHPLEEVLAKDSNLIPDVDYYLHKQILPPVERLCAPIDGTNITRLAECLGLDTSKYRVSNASGSADRGNEITSLESQIPDHIRFKDCEVLNLLCLGCKHHFEFRGLFSPVSAEQGTPAGVLTSNGLACPRPECQKQMSTLTLTAQLETQIRRHTSRYYDAWLVCDDAACGMRTRQMSVYGRRCLGPNCLAHGCSGKMRFEYSEKALYNQLLFLQRLFDVDKSSPVGIKPEKDEKGKVLADMNRERFGICADVVRSYLEKSGWGWVSMDSLFGFAIKAMV
ncbi:putative DNA polymerase alpha catalytic subunit [Piedraia hortae CBS 480.64]|uniref:DNA polymerase n=1 Tax=Piedraia hortae CBS 480.64 TaxID=1314780 RepID=A0A6A7C8H1_9PEZI|nr:putative DNA polymerase alpha catalytic subunit [Piedraia hortae CBS 480.64]